MLKELNKSNPDLQILSTNSPRLARYGAVLEGFDFSDMFSPSLEAMDRSGPTYIADLVALQSCPSFQDLKNVVFGELEIQAGICFGLNDKMNGMEYHKSSEVVIAVRDLILILGDVRDVNNNSWDSSLGECFFVREGTAVELFGGTLHLAPCRVRNEPFCSIVVLPKGTNTPLLSSESKKDPLLFMNNKWLLCHIDSPAVARGAYVGITGENIRISL